VTDPAASGIDAFCVGFGGFTPIDDLSLAVLAAEAEWREGGWEAIECVLSHVEEGRLVWPEDPVERAALFEAAWRLGWVGRGA
jgi:hypothetical protein